ncbi:MAG: translocation/assembly module TamB [Treponema sp.]|jgi:hypothetical protein|nr:translocation/assembly module TamB [Treponema sp.]
MLSSVKNEADHGGNDNIYVVFRISMEIFIFVALVIGTTFLLRPVQERLWRCMTQLRDELITQAEDFLGRELVYGSIGPSIFGTLDIRDIRVYGEDSPPVLTVSRFRVSYSLPALIGIILDKDIGNITESLHTVRIDRPVLTLDWDRDADLINLLFNQGAASPALSLDFLPESLLFRVSNGACELTSATNHFGVEGLTFDASVAQGMLQFQGTWNGGVAIDGRSIPRLSRDGLPAGLVAEELLKESLKAHTSMRIAGACATDLQRGNASLSITDLSGDLFRFRPLNLNLTLGDKKITLKKVNDRVGFDFSADYELDSGRLSLDFLSDHFSPRDILSLSGALKQYNPWLAIGISGSASLEQDPVEGIAYALDLSGVVPTGLLPLGRASFALAGTGDEGYINVDTLALILPLGKFRFQGGVGLSPLTPQGRLSVSDLTLSGAETVNTTFIVATQDNSLGREFRLFGADATFGTIALSNLDGSIMFEPGALNFLVSALCFSEGAQDMDAPPAQMALEGSFDYQSQYMEARVMLESFPVMDMMGLTRPFIPIPELSSQDTVTTQLNHISITTEAFIATDFTHISYNAPGFVMVYEGMEDIVANLSLSGTDRRFAINQGRIRWSNGEVGIAGYAAVLNPLDITFALETTYLDRSYYLEGTILDRRSISIQGSNGLMLEARMTEGGGYSGYIEVEDILIPVAPLLSLSGLGIQYQRPFVRLSLIASLHFDSLDSWYVDLDRLEIGDIQTPVSSMTSVQVAAGRVDQDGASFSPLVFNDGKGALTGTVSLSWNREFSDFAGSLLLDDEESLLLGDEEGGERYKLNGSYQDSHLSMHLEGSGMQSTRIIPQVYPIEASGDIQVEWDSLDSFSANLNLSALSTRIQDTDVHVTGSASLSNAEMVLQNLRITYGGLTADIPSFNMNREESRVATEAQIQGSLLGKNMETTFNLGATFKPIASWLHITEAINAFNGTMTVSHARFDTLVLEDPLTFVFSRAGSLVFLTGGPQDMIRLQISDTGDLFAGLSAPSPVRGTIIGTIDAQNIDVQVPDLYVDLVSLWRFIPAQNIINFPGGFVTASVRIAGPLGDPEFFGTARGTSIRIQIPQFLPQDIRPIPFTIVLEGNEMTFDPVPAAVGSGRGTIKGWFRFARWVPDTFTLDIRVPQEQPIPFGFDLMGIIAKGTVSGRLNLSMEERVLFITGDLMPDDTEITLNGEELAASQAGGSLSQEQAPVIADITIRTGRKVEFMWPTEKLPIIQASADMGTSLHIKSDVLTRRYSVIGDINLRSGEIFYFQRSFYMREGTLSFNENEIQFDPRISARAEVRDQTDDGPVTISMIIDNAPLQSFTARFESNPPLSQMEIFSFLGQNFTGAPTKGEDGAIQTPFVASAFDILAQTQVVRRFERIIRNFLKLDMFSIRTQMLQNLAAQAIGVQDRVDRIGGVGNYFDNTTVFLGKYIGSAMFFQFMGSFRYDENEHTLGGLAWKGLAFEPDFGIELRNPWFDIRWNIAPLHPEHLCIDDISFTVTWRRSGVFLKDCFVKPKK